MPSQFIFAYLESKAELAKDGVHTEILSTAMAQQRSNEDSVEQDDNDKGILANGLARMSESDVNQIDNLIINGK
jgi:hypothetical protein